MAYIWWDVREVEEPPIYRRSSPDLPIASADPYPDLRDTFGSGEGMASKQEYAIAGSYREFMEWRRDDLAARRYVVFLNTPERAKGREKGVVHRIGTWQVSPAREAAERLESLAKAVVGS